MSAASSGSPTRDATKERSRSRTSAQCASRRSSGAAAGGDLRLAHRHPPGPPTLEDEPGARGTQIRARARRPRCVPAAGRSSSRSTPAARGADLQEPPMTSRVQLALNVTDLEAATRRYSDLFGVEPAKTRPGYVNFAIDDPPLKLVLFENPGAATPLNHLGVELASTDDVLAAGDRFAASGLPHTVARDDRCCHAVQDKVWVDVPDVPLGAWEFYTVLADDDRRERGRRQHRQRVLRRRLGRRRPVLRRAVGRRGRVMAADDAVARRGPAGHLRADPGPRRRQPDGGARTDPRSARPQRSRQDHLGAGADHPGPPRRRPGPRRQHRRHRPPRPGATPHRGHRAVRRARRLPHHRREPRAGRAPRRPARRRPQPGPRPRRPVRPA